MLRVRPFEEEDAKEVVNWVQSEEEFYYWSAGLLGKYPASADKIYQFYRENEGVFFPMSLVDDEKVVGHFFLKKIEGNMLRIGFVMIDSCLRSKGYGQSLMSLALQYGKEKMGISDFSLAVHTKNAGAKHCYEKLGFEVLGDEPLYFESAGGVLPCWEMKITLDA